MRRELQAVTLLRRWLSRRQLFEALVEGRADRWRTGPGGVEVGSDPGGAGDPGGPAHRGDPAGTTMWIALPVR